MRPSEFGSSKQIEGPAAAEKRRTYPADECPPGFAFVPFAMGTQTELGASAVSLVNELAKREAIRICGEDVPHPAVVARCARVTRRELGVAVMRAQAEQILASVHFSLARLVYFGELDVAVGPRPATR